MSVPSFLQQIFWLRLFWRYCAGSQYPHNRKTKASVDKKAQRLNLKKRTIKKRKNKVLIITLSESKIISDRLVRFPAVFR